MSFGMFCLFVLASTVVLALVFIYREKLIDFEDAVFEKTICFVKGLFK